jgi:hypothetical protein
MEAICSSETSVDFEPTTRRYIPEDRYFPFLLADQCLYTASISIHCPDDMYRFSVQFRLTAVVRAEYLDVCASVILVSARSISLK